jgi:hypothetical protein
MYQNKQPSTTELVKVPDAVIREQAARARARREMR